MRACVSPGGAGGKRSALRPQRWEHRHPRQPTTPRPPPPPPPPRLAFLVAPAPGPRAPWWAGTRVQGRLVDKFTCCGACSCFLWKRTYPVVMSAFTPKRLSMNLSHCLFTCSAPKAPELLFGVLKVSRPYTGEGH
ncbi:hypothetical protein H8959_007443 [Pygathrix nigripes]